MNALIIGVAIMAFGWFLFGRLFDDRLNAPVDTTMCTACAGEGEVATGVWGSWDRCAACGGSGRKPGASLADFEMLDGVSYSRERRADGTKRYLLWQLTQAPMLPNLRPCSICEGRGVAPEVGTARALTCPHCHGYGRIFVDGQQSYVRDFLGTGQPTP